MKAISIIKYNHLLKYIVILGASISSISFLGISDAKASFQTESYGTIPAQFLHTWYHRDKDGHVESIKFTSHTQTEVTYWKGKRYKTTQKASAAKWRGPNSKWYNVQYAHQTGGAGPSYRVTVHNGLTALETATGTMVKPLAYYYLNIPQTASKESSDGNGPILKMHYNSGFTYIVRKSNYKRHVWYARPSQKYSYVAYVPYNKFDHFAKATLGKKAYKAMVKESKQSHFKQFTSKKDTATLLQDIVFNHLDSADTVESRSDYSMEKGKSALEDNLKKQGIDTIALQAADSVLSTTSNFKKLMKEMKQAKNKNTKEYYRDEILPVILKGNVFFPKFASNPKLGKLSGKLSESWTSVINLLTVLIHTGESFRTDQTLPHNYMINNIHGMSPTQLVVSKVNIITGFAQAYKENQKHVESHSGGVVIYGTIPISSGYRNTGYYISVKNWNGNIPVYQLRISGKNANANNTHLITSHSKY